MAVFRLKNIHLDNFIVDWQDSKMYDWKTINDIEDRVIDFVESIPSIPSPFAKIDHVKKSFQKYFREIGLCYNDVPIDPYDRRILYQYKIFSNYDQRRLQGMLSYISRCGMTVSKVFDVAQLFFNIDQYDDLFEILVWDRETDLCADNLFGKTLDLFLKMDAAEYDPYNLRKMKRIYLLNYIGPDRNSDLNIVGSTSPATLFLQSDDKYSILNHVLYGNSAPRCVPLYQRSFDFQKYLFALQKSSPEFNVEFPEIADYLFLTYHCLSEGQKEEIDQLEAGDFHEYKQILVGDGEDDIVEILGHPYHKRYTRRFNINGQELMQ